MQSRLMLSFGELTRRGRIQYSMWLKRQIRTIRTLAPSTLIGGNNSIIHVMGGYVSVSHFLRNVLHVSGLLRIPSE